MADGQDVVTAVVEQGAALTPVQPATPMELLARALDRGADLTLVEKLMDLQERHEKGLARKAFDAAVADAKSEIKPIAKNRKGHSGKYADLGAYAAAVDPILARHGLSYRYRSAQDGAVIRVTCVLSHRDGHCEETTLQGGADTSGAKNSIQAIGSTLTYLQRYSLTLALGLAATEDDDGASAGGDEPITEAQLETLRAKIDESGTNIEMFCKYLKVEALPDLRKSQFAGAVTALDQKIKAKKNAKKGGAQ